jgi:hypothetical protein
MTEANEWSDPSMVVRAAVAARALARISASVSPVWAPVWARSISSAMRRSAPAAWVSSANAACSCWAVAGRIGRGGAEVGYGRGGEERVGGRQEDAGLVAQLGRQVRERLLGVAADRVAALEHDQRVAREQVDGGGAEDFGAADGARVSAGSRTPLSP